MWQSHKCKVLAKAEYHHQYCFSDHYQNQKSLFLITVLHALVKTWEEIQYWESKFTLFHMVLSQYLLNVGLSLLETLKKQVISKIYLNINCIVIWKKIKTRLPMFSDVIAHLCRSMHIWNNVLTKQTGYDQLTNCVKINEENRLLYYQHTH